MNWRRSGKREDYLAGEFSNKDVEATLATMVEDASVDLVQAPINRVVDDGHLVDEIRTTFTHDRSMKWFLPGVPPTHRTVNIDIIVVVQFRSGKIICERIYRDQAPVLRQVGLLSD